MDPAPGIWPGGRSQAEFVMREEFRLPTLDLFDVPPPCQARLPQEELLEMADRLQTCLSNHNIDATVENAVQGPAVIRFDMRPAEAQRVAPIARLDREIAIAMRCDRVRILGPGAAGTIGVEIPSPKRETVFLVDLLKAPVFRTHPAPLAVPLGRGMSGEPVLCDLAATPHLLIAGSTGQGKSVCLNSILISLLMRRSPDELRLLLIDPKQVELNFFRAIPHLLAPIITEPRKAAAALQWVCEVMEHRYDLCKQLNTRNIDSYNAIARGGAGHPKAGGRDLEIMPHIIVVIDELADLMLQVRREIEEPFSRLAAKARACGIHLIVATQRPSVDVITGTIKNNFPSRIAFLTKTEADSRTVLGQSGAETLLGKGDMIYDLAGARELQRVQGCFVSEADVERVTDFLRAQGTVRYVKHDFPLAGEENRNGRVRTVSVEEYTPGSGSGEDEMERIYERALRLVLENRKASVSMVQRKLQIGFPKAGRLMDMMEERGIVGPADSSKVREILVDPDEYLRRMDEKDRDGIYYDE
jgi:S-DNA-T family DNA segregation ATPase FtsK/SpoIIIE